MTHRVVAVLGLLLGGYGFASEPLLVPEADFIRSQKPRIEKLFASLDLGHDGLASVRNAVNEQDWQKACGELIRYYRDRPRPSIASVLDPLEEAHPSEALRVSENVLGDTFTIQGVTARQPRLANGGIDWRDHGRRNDKEWAWLLNRHRYFRDLLIAYKTTNRDAFLNLIDAHLRDWIAAEPYPARLTFSESWRALEVARRVLDSWTHVFLELQHDPSFSAEARILMLSSILDHADALRYHSSFWGGNHLITEYTALAQIAIVWPEFREASEWSDFAASRIEDEIIEQTYPDGSYKELTNHYQRVTSWNAQRYLELLSRNNKPISPRLSKRIEAMWEYFVFVARPSGLGPLNNASDLEFNSGIGRIIEPFYDREDWRYAIEHGQSGVRPEGEPSQFFPWAGHAIMRGDWSDDALWAFFDIGPHGTGHQHMDRLHLSLSIGKEDILTDAGRYTYQPGLWRDYFSGPMGHNVLLLEGKPSIRPPLSAEVAPLPVRAQIEPEYDFFSAQVEFAGNFWESNAKHVRSVIHVRNRFWIISDHVIHYGPTTIKTLWNFHPDCDVSAEKDGLVATTQSGTSMRLRSIQGSDWKTELIRGQTSPEPLGWYAPSYNIKKPATVAVMSRRSNRPERSLWLALPAQPEEPLPNPEIHLETVPNGNVQMTLVWPDMTTDHIIFSDQGVSTFNHQDDPVAQWLSEGLHTHQNGWRFHHTIGWFYSGIGMWPNLFHSQYGWWRVVPAPFGFWVWEQNTSRWWWSDLSRFPWRWIHGAGWNAEPVE